MSWDVLVQDFPLEAQTVDDIPDSFEPKPIGNRSDIIGIIQHIVPSADFSDPSWGRIDTDSSSIEVNIGNDEVVQGFLFHVRGLSNDAIHMIDQILQSLRLRGIDTMSGEFFNIETAHQSFMQWQEWADHVRKVVSHESNPKT